MGYHVFFNFDSPNGHKMVESFIHSCMEEKLPDGDINADGNIEFL